MRKSWLWFTVKGLMALILVGLLVAGGFAIHYISWTQGYATGQQTADGEEVAAPLPYLYHGFYPGRHLGLARPLMCIGGLILFFFVIGGFFRMMFWHKMRAYGPWPMWHHPGPHWHRAARRARHWRRYGPMPPWWWDWEDEENKDSGDQSDAEK